MNVSMNSAVTLWEDWQPVQAFYLWPLGKAPAPPQLWIEKKGWMAIGFNALHLNRKRKWTQALYNFVLRKNSCSCFTANTPQLIQKMSTRYPKLATPWKKLYFIDSTLWITKQNKNKNKTKTQKTGTVGIGGNRWKFRGREYITLLSAISQTT